MNEFIFMCVGAVIGISITLLILKLLSNSEPPYDPDDV